VGKWRIRPVISCKLIENETLTKKTDANRAEIKQLQNHALQTPGK
jgi:hypothetical protein